MVDSKITPFLSFFSYYGEDRILGLVQGTLLLSSISGPRLYFKNDYTISCTVLTNYELIRDRMGPMPFIEPKLLRLQSLSIRKFEKVHIF